MSILIIIICRIVTDKLYKQYSNCIRNYDLVFISDKQCFLPYKNIIYYDNRRTINKNYKFMTSLTKCCAWDKCMRYIIENNNSYDYYWILEDDVYINQRFEELIKEYQQPQPKLQADIDYYSDFLYPDWYKIYGKNKWYHWKKGFKFFEPKHLHGSINQICRLSKRLVQKINNFRINNKRLTFHEILFASLCQKHGLTSQKIKSNKLKLSVSANDEHPKLNAKKKINFCQKNNIDIMHPLKKWHLYQRSLYCPVTHS